MTIETMQEQLVEELKGLYRAGKQIERARSLRPDQTNLAATKGQVTWRLCIGMKGVLAAMSLGLQVVVVLVSLVFVSVPRGFGQAQPATLAQTRIQREVQHELLMLPYFGVFDNLQYTVNGDTVTLLGSVTRPDLRSDAENAVKHIEGVGRVDNKIEVLPPSPMDDQLRLSLFRAIYAYPSLEKYALGVQKPIRIIAKNGHVTLEGVVDSKADKDAAGVRANGVPGVFSVTNNLQVRPS